MTKTSPSLQIFRDLITRNTETGELDVSGVVSRECYETWMKQKRITEENEDVAKRFLRTLLNHVSGTESFVCAPLSASPSQSNANTQKTDELARQDGRSPFPEDEQATILVLLRKKQPWPCFPSELSHFGQRYHALGYHERLAKESNAIMVSPAL